MEGTGMIGDSMEVVVATNVFQEEVRIVHKTLDFEVVEWNESREC